MHVHGGIFIVAAYVFLGTGGLSVAGTMFPPRESNLPEREAARDITYYDRVVTLYNHDPRRFEDAHPLYNKLLSDPSAMNVMLNRFETHQRRFEHWDPFLSRFLEGYIDCHVSLPVANDPAPAGPSGSRTPAAGVSAVPEPSAATLMISSLIIGLLSLASQTFSPSTAAASADDSTR